jgi:E3 ubiquitin-protein ligase HUWE1
MEYKPFDKLFRVLLSPEYLPTMKQRCGTDPIYCTPSSLGNSIDELIRHHINLRTEAMKSIITLLEQLVQLGNNPKYSSSSTGNDRNSSDDDDETALSAVPLLDYITNIMRFIEGVISNNTTDDHGKEFVKFGGLKLLLDILQMKNLPIDFPSSQACQCVVALCKSISVIKDNKFIEMIIINLDRILNSLINFYSNSSLLIEELTHTVSLPTLHQLSIVHSHIALLCEIIQSEVHYMFITLCGEEIGIRVLKNVNRLCLTLIWEKSIFTIDQQRILSKLDRALGEFYNLLVRQCSASQMIHGKDFYQQSAVAKLVASTLAEVLRDGFSFDLPANNNLTENQIEKIRLTFFIDTLG